MGFEGDEMQIKERFKQEIMNKLEQKIYHQFLTSMIGTPKIDTDKLTALLILLESQNLTKDEIEQYAITVMLIQIALDTHDLVKNDDEFMPTQERQLTVLAGDYYSGLYYKNLSDLSNIKLVQLLASGIKIVNENKILVYKQEVKTFDQYMASIKNIETAIYEKMAAYFEDEKWIKIITDLLFFKRLTSDKEAILNYIVQYDLKLSNGKKATLSNHYEYCHEQLNDYIRELNENLQKSIESEPNLLPLIEKCNVASIY